MKDNLTLPFSKLVFCSPAPRSLSLFSLRALFDLAAARWPIFFFFLRPPTSFLCHIERPRTVAHCRPQIDPPAFQPPVLGHPQSHLRTTLLPTGKPSVQRSTINPLPCEQFSHTSP